MRNSNASPSLGLLFSTATALVSPASETVTQRPLYGAVPPLTVRSGVKSLIRELVALIGTWRRRADERTTLSRLDDHQLRDIGLGRSEVDKELAKPFWQA